MKRIIETEKLKGQRVDSDSRGKKNCLACSHLKLLTKNGHVSNTVFKAATLYYAIFISFLVALSCAFLFLSIWFHHYHTLSLIERIRLRRNVNSALVLAMDSLDQLPMNQTKTIDLFGDGESDVNLTKTLWGGFFLIQAQAQWRNLQFTSITLCGNDITDKEAIALYLSDKQRYLSISGNTLLKGNCYLPKLGVRRAYIEGKSFTGDELVQGTIEISKQALPELDPITVRNANNYFSPELSASDSAGTVLSLEKSDTVSNSFYRKTLVFYTNQWITLQNKAIRGNIRIVSSRGITVDGSLIANDILLCAPKIEISTGFSGTVQLFATDTVQVADNVTLMYPSLIALLADRCPKPRIETGENCFIAGDIFLQSGSSKNGGKAECHLGENTEVDGRVYSNGNIQLKGTVDGTVYCDGFILRTPTSVYENNLLDATIDVSSLSKFYSGSAFLAQSTHYKQIKWEQ